MNYKHASRSNRLFHALTGISVCEFHQLAPVFEGVWSEYQSTHLVSRKRKVGGGRIGSLPTAEDKLFFILWYAKTYPTYDLAGFYLGIVHTKAYRWVTLLTPILEKVLKRTLHLPPRRIATPEEFERLYPGVREVFIDGIERSIQRSKDTRIQRRNYSGKKKTHTRKSVIGADFSARILALTPQKQGRRHEKRLLEKAGLLSSISPEVELYADTGFQGVQKTHAHCYIPSKGSKKQPLTPEQKTHNRHISSLRVVVEHAIGAVKRYRWVADRLRTHIPGRDDQYMRISAGLWNFHLSMR
jgi:hypothetical protein